MTEQEFERRKAEILSGITPKFHQFISEYAWEQGHSNGYSEVLSVMEDLVYGLNRIKNENT